MGKLMNCVEIVFDFKFCYGFECLLCT